MRTRFHELLKVRFADTDAQGHVFFANYLTFFDEALTGYFAALGFPYGGEAMGDTDIVYKASSCEHLSRSLFGDILHIDVQIARVGNTSLTFAFAAYRDDGQELVARGTLTCVTVDKASLQPRRVPQALRDGLAAFEPAPVAGL